MKRKIYKLLSGAKQGLFAFVLTVFLGTTYSQTVTLNYTGGPQNTTLLLGGNYKIECWGADGGDINAITGGNGGKGGYSRGEFNATAGTLLTVLVGGKGTNVSGTGSPGGNGGWNGGGGGGYCGRSGGGGGGATDVRVGGTAASNRIIVAGGGGGAAYYALPCQGGNGGATLAGNGETITSGNVLTVGTGGAGANGGSPGVSVPTFPSADGTTTGGGGGGNSPGGFGQPGTGGGAGGAGGSLASGATGSSGGGGGGYAGGAGGGQTVNAGVGGGGGSGYVGTLNNAITVQNGQTGFVPNPDPLGAGYVIITRLCAVTATVSKSPICLGESVALSTDAAGGIIWSHTSSTANTVNISPTATQNYTVIGQAASGCTTAIILSVIVNPLPALSAIVNPSVLCLGSVATLTAFGANTYTWSATNAVGNTTTVNPTVNSAFTYSGTNQYGCVSSTLVSVVVNTNVLGATANTIVCKGSSINLTATGAQSYTWSNGPMFATTPVSPTVSTTYTVLGRDIHNCVLSKVVSVTVNDPPLVVATANKTLVCKGDNVVITGSGADTYTWSTGFVGASLSTTLPVDIPYYFSVTGADLAGCKKTVNITIQVAKCLGISEMNNSALLVNVYPNPGIGLFNVKVEKVTDQLNMKVYNQLGMLVKTQDIVSTESKLDLQNETNGLYFVRISDKNNVVKVIKLIKE